METLKKIKGSLSGKGIAIAIREIPETWPNNNFDNLGNNSFGVNLIETSCS